MTKKQPASQTSLDFVKLYEDESVQVEVVKGEKQVTIKLEDGSFLKITRRQNSWAVYGLYAPDPLGSSLAFMPTSGNSATLFFPK